MTGDTLLNGQLTMGANQNIKAQGGVFLQNATDSNSAFNLQNAGGTTLLNVSTTNKQLAVTGGFQTTFVRTWGGTDEDVGNFVQQTSDGGYIVTGHTKSYGAGNYDMILAKYDALGNLSWNKTWGGSGEDHGNSVQQTSDGGYIVTGETLSYGAGNRDMFLAKYDSAGNLIWNKTWGGTSAETGYSVQQTSDGGYIVTGAIFSYGAGSGDIFLAKYDALGNLAWNKTWGGTGDDQGYSVQQTSDGGYIVTGYTVSYGAGSNDMLLVKYDALGNLTWNKTWGGASYDYGKSVQQTSDGGYVVTGYTNSYGAGSNDMLLVKYDALGNLAWNKTWGGTGDDQGYSVQQTSDGGYIVTGYAGSYGGNGSIFLAKYDALGNLTWNKTWGGSSTEQGYSAQQTSDGGYIVTGYTYSYGAGSSDMVLAKYDSAGNIFGCSSACGSPSASVSSPSASVSAPSASVSSPSASQASVSPAQSIPIVANNTTEAGHAYTEALVVTGNTLLNGQLTMGANQIIKAQGGVFLQNATDSNSAFKVQNAGGTTLLNVDTINKKLSVSGGGNTTFVKTWGGTPNDDGQSVQQTSDGGYIVTGQTTGYGAGFSDMYLAKYDTSGNLSWSKTWGGAGYDYGYSVQQTSDGGYIVTGSTSSYGAGSDDMFLVKYDSAGTLSWNKTWGGAGYDYGYSIQQTSDGGYIVTGRNPQLRRWQQRHVPS